MLESVILEPEAAHKKTIIWLHGLGADGHDFVPVGQMLGLQKLGFKLVFPHAPVRPVTINMGQSMRAWYDIKQINLMGDRDISGIEDSLSDVKEILDNEAKLVGGYKNTILSGFSQGGAIALQLGLSINESIGGLMALSTYLPIPDLITEATADFVSLLQIHGVFDPVVPYALAEKTKNELEGLKYTVDFHALQMMHEVNPQALEAIKSYLIARL